MFHFYDTFPKSSNEPTFPRFYDVNHNKLRHIFFRYKLNTSQLGFFGVIQKFLSHQLNYASMNILQLMSNLQQSPIRIFFYSLRLSEYPWSLMRQIRNPPNNLPEIEGSPLTGWSISIFLKMLCSLNHGLALMPCSLFDHIQILLAKWHLDLFYTGLKVLNFIFRGLPVDRDQ